MQTQVISSLRVDVCLQAVFRFNADFSIFFVRKCVKTSNWPFEWRCQWKVYHQHWQTGRWCVEVCVSSPLVVPSMMRSQLSKDSRSGLFKLGNLCFFFLLMSPALLQLVLPSSRVPSFGSRFWHDEDCFPACLDYVWGVRGSPMWVRSTQREYIERRRLSQTCYKSPYLYLLLWDDREETWKVTVFRVVICWVNVLSGRRCLDCKCEVIVWVGQYNGLMLWMNYSDSEVFLNHVKRVWISRLKRAEYCLSLSHFTLSSSPSA